MIVLDYWSWDWLGFLERNTSQKADLYAGLQRI